MTSTMVTLGTRPDGRPTLLSDLDLHLFNEGTHARLYEKLGAHLVEADGPGAQFATWAPSARRVTVTGSFDGWSRTTHDLQPRGESGIWEGFVPRVRHGDLYKFVIWPQHGPAIEKADPFAARCELRPRTASVAWDVSHAWEDAAWMARRGERQSLHAPMSIYEVHLGSWRRVPEEGGRMLTYREAAPLLADHALSLGFTHVELMPIMEHPFDGSWGYQVTGFFAPTSRHGTPQDFMAFVEHLHARGLGVILDWVPSHFPADPHALALFDGTHLFEHADPRQGVHPDWGSLIFNYARHEVRSFLLSAAHCWLDRYHADALRTDAVASMLYLDYSRKPGEWVPNEHGGRENLGAVSFLRAFNEHAYAAFPGIQTIAEESTAWPGVSKPTWAGGLGFGLKWDMGWMHDTLEYLAHEPVHRRWHHDRITFRALYAFSENYVLPLSHDEVVHGKGSLLGRMPGDDWQRFASLRLLFALQHAQPGKKLLFMGGELAQRDEWRHDHSLDWHLLGDERHAGVLRLVRDLNALHAGEPALHELDCDPAGFSWVDASDNEASIVSFLRLARDGRPVLAVFNFTPVPRHGYRIGVPEGGRWRELINTDAACYGGSNVGSFGGADATQPGWQGRPFGVDLTLPPLGALLLAPERRA